MKKVFQCFCITVLLFTCTSCICLTKYSQDKNDYRDVNADIFIAKFDTLGKIIWAKCAGNKGDEFVTCIAINKLNNIVIGGFFNSTFIDFGKDTLTAQNRHEIFLAKISSDIGVK